MDVKRISSALGVVAAMSLASASQGEILNFVMTLDGGQEVPPVDTVAFGNGTATLDTDSNLFSWNITFQDLSAPQTAAHFHAVAPQCEGAGIAIGLPNGSPIIGSATVTATQAGQIISGLWYVNVHTSAHTGGEIRGQVMPAPLDLPLPDITAGDFNVRLESVATGLTAPNWGTAVSVFPDRLFVTDQDGQLLAIDTTNGNTTVFLDVSAQIVEMGAFGPRTFDERGLLGVAFHPDYATNGKLYTYQSEPPTGVPDFTTMPLGEDPNHQTAVVEWTVPDPTNPASVVDMNSRRELLRIDEPQFNHNAGCLNFGPDGMLYIALGDGGAGDDQGVGHGCPGNASDISNILGKIIRIDPLGNDSANGEYGIPDDNPFKGDIGVVEEIYAFGLRNPFRFSFDSDSGDLLCADVGQNAIEEVNIITSGGDYGWNYKEGSFFFVRNGDQDGYITDQPLSVPAGLLDPVAEYDHHDGIAVVGGFVYRGSRMPFLTGRYVFGEFAQTFDSDGRLFYLDEANEIREFLLIDQAELGMYLLGFGQDADGEIYVLANGTGIPFESTGVVLRIEPQTGDFNGDGEVGPFDLAQLLAQWGACPAKGPCPADLAPPGGDGDVGPADLAELLANWG